MGFIPFLSIYNLEVVILLSAFLLLSFFSCSVFFFVLLFRLGNSKKGGELPVSLIKKSRMAKPVPCRHGLNLDADTERDIETKQKRRQRQKDRQTIEGEVREDVY